MDFMPIYSDKKRKAEISKEQKKLAEIFQNVDTNQMKIINNLINEASFMAVILTEMRLTIQRDGPIETYQNGENQKGTKKSPAIEMYDKIVNTYARVIKQLCDLLPTRAVLGGEEEEEEDPAAELQAFLKGFRQ